MNHSELLAQKLAEQKKKLQRLDHDERLKFLLNSNDSISWNENTDIHEIASEKFMRRNIIFESIANTDDSILDTTSKVIEFLNIHQFEYVFISIRLPGYVFTDWLSLSTQDFGEFLHRFLDCGYGVVFILKIADKIYAFGIQEDDLNIFL